jgi:alpha-glucosidase
MPTSRAKAVPIGNLENFHRERHIFDLFFGKCLGRVSVVTANIIRVQFTTEPDWPYKPLLSIEEKEWKSVPIQIKRHPEKLDITTPRLIISLVFRPFNIRIYDHEGHLLTQDNPKCSVTIKGDKIQAHKKCPPKTPILGMGDVSGPMDRSGKSFPFEMSKASADNLKKHENPQIIYPVGYYKGKDHAVGFFLDNPHKALIDFRLSEKGNFSMETENQNMDYYIMIGEDFEEISRSVSLLIGNSALPPRWSLEIMKGLESPLENQTFLNQFNRIREEFLVTSSLITHQPPKDSTGFWDERPHELLKSFRRADEIPHFLLEMDQKISTQHLDKEQYSQLLEENAFVETQLGSGKAKSLPGQNVFIDPFYDAGMSFIKERLAPLYDHDLRGLEISDPCPPWTRTNISDASVRCVQEIIAEDGESVEKLIHEIDAKHLLGYMPNGLSQGLFQVSKKIRPELRPLLVSTCGYAGIQRYSILRLLHSNLGWKDLPLYLSRLLSLNISGAPLLCADIELGKKFDDDLISHQILMLAFVPLIRLKLDPELDLQKLLESDTFIDTLEFAFGLREAWLPYLYQLTWRAHEEGLPILHPILYFFEDWEPAKEILDQYMLGSGVLVAPFMEPKSRQRTVHLPPGLWADSQTFQVYEGPCQLSVDHEATSLPIYFREGAIVPTYETQTDGLDRAIVVTFFPKNDLIAESFLYDDDGDSNNYQQQQHANIQLKLSSTKKGYVLKLARRQGRLNPSWSSYLLRFIHSRLDIQRVVYNRTELVYYTSLEELSEAKMGFYLDDELEMLYIKVPYEREGGVVRF